jgi:hypothetical protein
MGVEASGLNIAQTFEVFCASRLFMSAQDRFEQPVPHSEGDHVLELVRARTALLRSEVMCGPRFTLEVAEPIRDFALSARWVISLSYRRSGLSPDGLADGYIVVYREDEPLVSGIRARGTALFEQIMRDLS